MMELDFGAIAGETLTISVRKRGGQVKKFEAPVCQVRTRAVESVLKMVGDGFAENVATVFQKSVAAKDDAKAMNDFLTALTAVLLKNRKVVRVFVLDVFDEMTDEDFDDASISDVSVAFLNIFKSSMEMLFAAFKLQKNV